MDIATLRAPRVSPRQLSACGVAAASAILAIEPVRWLIATWRDPSQDTVFWLYLVVLAALIVWSVTSPRLGDRHGTHRTAAALLVVAAVLRLISQVSAINIVGGMALALDIFALLTWFGLGERARPLSPFWVAVLFLFTLPFERIAQRILGYPMQEASAFGACRILSGVFSDLVCEGVRLSVAGEDVLVDLPCSGTASLMISLTVITVLNAVFRPRLGIAAAMVMLALVLAVVGNALRISVLAIGLVFAPTIGIDVMTAPAHDLIGIATLTLSLVPVMWLCHHMRGHRLRGPAGRTDAATLPPRAWPLPVAAAPYVSAGFLLLALMIVSLPRQAFDVSRELGEIALPPILNGTIKQLEPLTGLERAYFQHYGGTAQKARYGPLALTVVRTTSPLRHLHAPDECLRGLGYRVRFVGTRFEPVPTALYRAEDRDGRAFAVAVTFAASDGFLTSNVAEAIWRWLQAPGLEWQSVQRITPWSLNDAVREDYERAAVAALDLPFLAQR